METARNRKGLDQGCSVSVVLFLFPCRPYRSSPALTYGMGHCPGGTPTDQYSTALSFPRTFSEQKDDSNI